MLAENLLISVINVFKINNIDTRSIILFFFIVNLRHVQHNIQKQPSEVFYKKRCS